MKGKFRKVDLRENNREGRLFYREETKSNRVEIVGFKAFRFRFKAFRFRFDAIRFAAKALRFPFVGPRLQRDHRRNLREGFAFDFGAMSRRFATRRFTQMKQISQIWLYLKFECQRHRKKALSQSAKPERNLQEPLRAKRHS